MPVRHMHPFALRVQHQRFGLLQDRTDHCMATSFRCVLIVIRKGDVGVTSPGPISAADTGPISAADMRPISAADMGPISAADMGPICQMPNRHRIARF